MRRERFDLRVGAAPWLNHGGGCGRESPRLVGGNIRYTHAYHAVHLARDKMERGVYAWHATREAGYVVVYREYVMRFYRQFPASLLMKHPRAFGITRVPVFTTLRRLSVPA